MILSGKSRLAGVMGWPVGHSRSPRLHGYWLNHYVIDGAYVPLPVRPEDLPEAFRLLPRLGFGGWNVTLPHKERAAGLVRDLTPRALRAGAVNTVIVGEDGALSGDNTDGYGFLENLRAAGCDPAQGKAVILGAGGGARAVLAALVDAGTPEILLLNRGRERAVALASAIGGAVTVRPWEDRAVALAGAHLLVNTTNQGMVGNPPLDIALDALPTTAWVNDLIYVPLETDLLRRAKARGNRVVDGLGMLLHQARIGFQGWFGVEPQVTTELRRFILETL